ncbi:DMT family transporter [Priestia endophytica]|uniref:DMT family transporter n=1 Tax=Priestia endophytica TaxID=135735 RepID=UPI000DCA6846|nr:DMT family transporter [Priestia endophytica]RAS75298.1 EamA family transporter [Priestia endophytica]
MTEKSKAYIAAIAYAFIIGLSFMFVKMTLVVATPLDTLAHRFTIAFIGATIFIQFTKNKLKIHWRDITRILPLALLYPMLFFAFQIFGLARTSSSEAGIIQATIPIFTLLFAIVILKERAKRVQLVFICLSVIGVIYLLVMNGTGAKTANLVGSALIIVSSIASALYNVFARKLTQHYSLLTITYVMTLFGFVVFNSMAIGSRMIEGTMGEFFQPFLHLNFVLAILYLGILSSLVTSYLSNFALSKIEAAKMSVFSNVATLITIVAGVLFLQETFHFYHLIGGIIIIIGVVGTNFVGVRGRINKKA